MCLPFGDLKCVITRISLKTVLVLNLLQNTLQKMGKKYKNSAEIVQLLEESSSDKDQNDQNAGRAYSSDNIILCTLNNGEKDAEVRSKEVEGGGGQKFDYNRIKKNVIVKSVVLPHKDYIKNIKSNRDGQVVTSSSLEHPSEVSCPVEGNDSSESMHHNQVDEVDPDEIDIADIQLVSNSRTHDVDSGK